MDPKNNDKLKNPSKKKKLKKHFKNMDSVMVALDPKKNGLE